VPEDDPWTPYPHEEVRVGLLWRKRLILAAIVGGLFLFWAMSLGIDTTESENEVDILGEEGDEVEVERSEQQNEPVASVTLQPGETANLDEDLDLGQQEQPPQLGTPPPQPQDGIPFTGLLLLLGPFLAAYYAWRYLQDRTTSTVANYGVFKGPLPLEMVTASHASMVRTGREVERNPFGKARGDYLRDALNDPSRERGTPRGARGAGRRGRRASR
jgi:hypothetical protein